MANGRSCVEGRGWGRGEDNVVGVAYTGERQVVTVCWSDGAGGNKHFSMIQVGHSEKIKKKKKKGH